MSARPKDADELVQELARTKAVELARFVHPCPKCEADQVEGAVYGWYTERGLARHLQEVHGVTP